MALGIDIYRYQTVTDPRAVKRAGVAFAVVKATDGGGQAIVPADHQVAQMKLAGIPVGLYHYAQLSPSPEIQADVLCKEVRRLGATGTPPALDLEDPHVPGGKARDFAQRFLRRVRANGFPYVLLYGNTSMLTGINAESLGVDNVLIWEASYGSNSGNRNPLPSRPWARRIHQYTSLGTVPGISGKVDLNESLGPIPGVDTTIDDMEDTVALTDPMYPYVWPYKPDTTDAKAGHFIADTKGYAETAALAAVRIEAKLDAQAGTLSNNQAAVLAAIEDNDTEVELNTEQLQALLVGMTAASKKALAQLLGSLDNEPTT